MNNDNSIFIVGLDRCGKTTLRAFLASHPNIAIPEIGTNMWIYFFRRYGDLSQSENLNRCINAMIKYKHIAFLQPEPGEIRREFSNGPQTYAHLFAIFLAHYAKKKQKPRWGDQSGLNEGYAVHIFNAYPQVKMIHMIRDPRDRYEASLAMWPDGKGRAGGATARWQYTTRLAEMNLQRYPGRYMLLRYEDLVTRTREKLEEVCKFLDEDCVPEMLSMDGAPEFRQAINQGSDPESGEVILSTAFIGRFRESIPEEDTSFIQTFTKKGLLRYGYSLMSIHFSIKELIRYYLVNVPSNFGRMMIWRFIINLQKLYPGKFGKKLPKGMKVNV